MSLFNNTAEMLASYKAIPRDKKRQAIAAIIEHLKGVLEDDEAIDNLTYISTVMLAEDSAGAIDSALITVGPANQPKVITAFYLEQVVKMLAREYLKDNPEELARALMMSMEAEMRRAGGKNDK